ncbi:MAG: HNH endonuclease, partial [Thermoanaerobaculia bacterium]
MSRRALAFYLLEIHERREYKALGYASTFQYAEGVLGISAREARDLLRVARALEELPELNGAFAAGEIGWSKLREISLVAVGETELEWLEVARTRTCREVELAVKRVRRGQKPPGDDLGTPRVTFRIQYDLPAALNALWETALEKLLGEAGEGATPLDALKRMAEMAIGTDPEGPVPGRKERREPVYRVVYHVGSDGKAWCEGEEGRVPIPLAAALAAAPVADVIEVPDLKDPGAVAIRFGERGSVPAEERDRPTPRWMRSAVLARENERCAVCRSRYEPRVHHLESVANGGETRIEYLVTLCLLDHSLVHDGFLTLEVNEQGRVVAKDRNGRLLCREISALEALCGAPEEAANTVIVVEAQGTLDPGLVDPPECPRGHPETSQVLSGPHPRLESRAPRSTLEMAFASLEDLPPV